ncbi:MULTISPECIES: hypothetical protein [unclassified Acinetobacter]|uniref:DUF2281 domain-containing protein n=1 Tax=Acinetobacter corruptisaponis TaxID=3045147 RepID=A0ABY8S7C3_9GAMM|nr:MULTISPECIES: hypothetical protein [unclassified Acinetobacter]MDH0031997.1 DUF2281 domain-containing protein [Acinetobacter sp. GD04021]MDH0887406.1 DUF2281 domain-containing protein [Acinetobacter sp. GD03873]MDH1084001.1 DUF2281 domain-containing protein [Acinetobacter sp. GD03983]MDH2190722.1 DUF2281 domain-containing protein [Acinetobacter sp. GD03645]MDH2202212.1 DUF2281 domain-containing protein [Acinetobacter sp. GD03647]
MHAIELPVEIDSNHQIHVQLPENIKAKKARIIVMYETEKVETRPVYGSGKGLMRIADDFDEPLDELKDYME